MQKEGLVRVSISIEPELFDELEAMVHKSKYANRSEFIRDLIRAKSAEEKWEKNQIVVGTITLIYDHHKRQLADKLTDVQHDFHKEVIAATHVHLNNRMCAEVVIAKGRAEVIQDLFHHLQREKGVLHAELSMSPG